MSNIYYSPEKYGLRTIGEVDFSSGSYEFDTLVVWQDVETGRLYYAEDSGCSCPCPFDYTTRETITPLANVDELRSRLKHRADTAYSDYVSVEDIDRLVAAAKEAVK